MKKPETKLEGKIVKLLKKKLKFLWLEKIQQASILGTPDRIGCHPCKQCGKGLFFALELKDKDNNDPDPIQSWKLSEIERCGGLGLVVRSKEDLAWLMKYLDIED